MQDNDGGGEGVQREADMPAYTDASLSFSYRPDSLGNSDDYASIDVSSDGGATWTQLTRIEGPADEGNYLSFSQNISSFISNNTRIRFLSSSNLGYIDRVYFDDVEIALSGCAQ